MTAAMQKFQPARAETWYAFFSKSGFTEDVAAAAGDRVRLLTAEDILKE